MRIANVTAYHVRIPFVTAFSHALQSRSHTEAIILKVVSSQDHTGIGEILPRPYLTGETIESVVRDALPTIVQRWARTSLEDRDHVLAELNEQLRCSGRDLATFAGWETAILDVAGQDFGFSPGDVLGPAKRSDLATGVVIDFDIRTCILERHCRLLRLCGHHHLKVKVGLMDDLHRLQIIHNVFGPEYGLRLDANGAWCADEAIQHLRELKPFNVISVEQPVPAHDLSGMRAVREKTGIPVVADESLCTVADGESLIHEMAADIFNIRIAKCGGLLGSSRLLKLAQRAGLSCQLGTLVGETGILSRVAETLGQRVGDFAFLEGKGQNKRLLERDIVEILPESGAAAHGYGIALNNSTMAQLQVSPPTVFEQH